MEVVERQLVELDLSSRNGAALRLIESRVENVDLSGAALRGASIRDVVVNGGSWANIDISNATLQRIEMRGVRLTGAILANASVSDVSFVDCRIDLSSVRFAQLERVRFENCRMEESDFYEATLSSVVFEGCDLTKASIAKTTFERCEMRDCTLDGIGNPEQLRGVGMPWPDIVRTAAVLAAAAGVHLLDGD